MVGVRVLIHIHRQSTTEDFDEIGELFLNFDQVADNWQIALASHIEDAGVTFTITAAGQVQYSSTLLGGASYVGTLKMKNVTKIAL